MGQTNFWGILSGEGVFHQQLLHFHLPLTTGSISLVALGQVIYRQALWMKLHGHMCLKRTLLWSTSPAIRILDLGRVQKSKHKSLVKTAWKYKDANGVQRYKGSKNLKSKEHSF